MSGHASGARLFDEARAAMSVEDLALVEKVKLRRAGKELRGACPLCGAGQGSGTAFWVKDDHWGCYGCGAGGDVTDLERALRGGSLAEAARRLTGGVRPERPAPRREPVRQEGPKFSDLYAAELWKTARPSIEGTLAERYLANRGIAYSLIGRAAERLRFHPYAKHSWDDVRGGWVRAPAMVAQVVTESGPTGGVHATYLSSDGYKAALKPAKRMWGPQLDAQGRPGGAWLIGPDDPWCGELIVGEGIETSLSAATLALKVGRNPPRVAAALSLGRLQGGLTIDSEGCADLWAAQGDPERPAFVWTPPADQPWPRVLVAVDSDMSPIKLLGRTGRGKPVRFELDSEARAKLCARLATSAWKATGTRAQAWFAPAGGDHNDALMASAGRVQA